MMHESIQSEDTLAIIKRAHKHPMSWAELSKRCIPQYCQQQNSEALELIKKAHRHPIRYPFERLQKGYNPDEPRDESGRWTTGGDSASGEEGDNGNTTVVGGAGNDPVPESWGGDPEKFKEHFEQHGNNFNAKSPEDYASKAKEFYEQGINENLPAVEDPSVPKVSIYDSESNTFGAYNPDGTTRSFYKPRAGVQYYNNKVTEALENGGKVINPLPKTPSTSSQGGSGGGGFDEGYRPRFPKLPPSSNEPDL